MQLGMIGLGRMGYNMALRLLNGGHQVVVYDIDRNKVDEIEKDGALCSGSIKQMILLLKVPRIVWSMLPAGRITENAIEEAANYLEPGDLIIDGGNSNYRDDLVRAEMLKEKDINYLDAGISGGVWGLKEGYCTMVGGSEKSFKHIEPILKTLAPEEGYLYCGSTGAGHFVKMVHNGIEYAMMESYGEGFEILKASSYGEYLDFEKLSHLWNHGSVIRSWLLELLETAFSKDPNLNSIQGYVEDSGETRWTVKEAIDLGVSVNAIAHSLFKRFQSRQKDLFSNKILAALRNEFGGHATYTKEKEIKTEGAGAGEVHAANPADEWKKKENS